MNELEPTACGERARALVIYESMFGNTRDVARAVEAGIATMMDVTTVEVGDAPAAIDERVDLLVVGAPTHAFGLSRPSTRDSAAERSRTPLVSPRDGLREWIGELNELSRPVDVAGFDTKMRGVPGSAARAALRRLRRLGFDELGPAASFYVEGVEGPPTEGELIRARRWARDLAAVAAARSRQPVVTR